ncbi:MAG: hypothetical protein HPY44_15750 [Armatimonadetes bacterium]|nr:hypothetical protein [Armatimonadota bacterium]
MLEYDGISELIKAAPRRLSDARELLEQPAWEPNRSDANYRHLVAAVYLAGYAVECLLKAYIIDRTDAVRKTKTQTWSQVLEYRKKSGKGPDLSGARSHDLELLLRACDLPHRMQNDLDLRAAWGKCVKRWRPSLRYRPDPITDHGYATDTVDAIETVYEWLKTQRCT